MMRQWDALIDRHQATMYPCPGCPRDRRICCWYETLVVIRWAAIRDTGDDDADADGAVHLAFGHAQGRARGRGVVAVQPPELLAVTGPRDSPVIICLKELSATLLRHHKKPSDKTAWKRAKLAEILLSDQVQQFRVPWNHAFPGVMNRRTIVR